MARRAAQKLSFGAQDSYKEMEDAFATGASLSTPNPVRRLTLSPLIH